MALPQKTFSDYIAGLTEATSVGETDYAPIVQGGVTKKFAPPSRIGGVVNVADHGAVGDGVTDDSAAVEDAIDALGGAGVVVFPKGTFILENITIPSDVIFRGQGWRNTTLKLPAAAANPMFVFKEAARAEMSSFEYLGFEGNGTDGQDGIDFSLATAWEFSTVRACYFTNFRRAIIGSQSDRYPYITETHFHANDIGLFVHNNHPRLTNCDFRDNRIGIGGDGTIYDFKVFGCNFVRNEYGINPYEDGGSINQAFFNGCMIFGNREAGAIVGSRIFFSNCLLVSQDISGTSSKYGIIIRGSDCAFIGGQVKPELGTGFTEGAFFVPGIETFGGFNITINGVRFDTDDFFVVDSELVHRRIKITNCTGKVRGAFARLRTESSNGFQVCQIKDNDIEIDAANTLTTGEGVIEISTSLNTAGNIITGNTIQALDAGFVDADGIRVDGRASIIADNIIRRTAGITLTDSNELTVQRDNIYTA